MDRNRSLVLLLFAFLGLIVTAQGQEGKEVSGIVRDSMSGEPLFGANIKVRGTGNGTSSDEEGRFSLRVRSDSAHLLFSYLGYAQKELELKGKKELRVGLDPNVEGINEVVVTALGKQRQENSLGYSVQKIQGKELEEVREPNIVDGLAGRVAGVRTTSGASGVGSSSRIVIRGQNSLSGNNQALFVVDGIPIRNRMVPNRVENDETGFQEVDYENGAAAFSSNDIASISVLKGPSAAALYGSRAANGVVLIETKDGSRAQDGIGVSVHSSLTFETPLTMPQYQNQYGQGSGGKFAFEDGEGGGVNDGAISSFGPALNGQPISQFDSPSRTPGGTPVRGGDVIARQGEPIEPTAWEAHPNNVRNFFRTGITNMNHIALSGGDRSSSFRLSYSNTNSEDIIPNVDLKRHGVAFSGKHRFNERFSARTFINYIKSGSSHRPALGYGSENPMYLFTWMGRQVDVNALKDYWQHGQKGRQQYNFNYNWMDNPYLATQENTNAFEKDRLIGNIKLNYAISDRIELRFLSGIDRFNELRTSKRAFSTQRFEHGAYREDAIEYQEINSDLRLSYQDRIGPNIDFTLSAGGNIMDRHTNYNALTAEKLSVPGVYNFENARSSLVAQQHLSRKRINSLYGIFRGDYKDLLFLDLTYRNDRSSTLPDDRNAYSYYSGGVSLLLSEVLDLPSFMDLTRIRFSGASVGNDTRPYRLKNSFVFNQRYGSQPLVTSSSAFNNPNLRPERTNALEAGAELWFLDSRLGIDASVYQNNATQQIIRLPASSASGYRSRLVNGGRVRSRGVEAIVHGTPVDGKAFEWKAFLNFSRNVSRVMTLPEGIDRYTTGRSSVYDAAENTVYYIAAPGQGSKGGRVGAMYGTGFKKVDGEVVFDENGLPVRSPELRHLGNYNPEFVMGFGNTFSYKRLSFHFLWDWRHGGVVVSRTKSVASTSGVLKETAKGREEGIVGDGVTNVGSEEEPKYVENTTRVSAEAYYNQFYNRANEEPAVYDASYLKLRETRLSYRLPGRWVQKAGMESVTLSLIGRNLLLFTENPHFDPELNTMQGTEFAYGVEDMAYPSSRSYGMSVRFKF